MRFQQTTGRDAVRRTCACGAALTLTALLTWPAAAAPACRPVKAESDINGIRIADEASARRVIGSQLKDQGPRVEQDKDASGADTSLPYVRFATRDGRQELKPFIHYGDVVDSYNEVAVAPATMSTAKRLPFDAFATERGIKLGMREKTLIRLLGSCYTREGAKDGAATIAYAITDESDALLRRAKMPSYYARYTFRAGRLVRFALASNIRDGRRPEARRSEGS